MISGYFLFSRIETVSTFYKKRFLKIFPPLLFWSAVFYTYNVLYIGVKPYSISELLIRPASAHLWYLYAITGLYLFAPFISKIYNNSSSNERIVFLVIWFMTTSVIPMLNSCFGVFFSPGLFQLTTIFGYIGFFFIGAWIKDHPSRKDRLTAFTAFALYVLLSVLTMYLTRKFSIESGKPTGVFYSYISPYVILAAASLFYCFTSLEFSGKFTEAMANGFAKFSLGVYCIHPIFIWPLAKYLRVGGDVQPTEIYIGLTCLIVFTASCVVSFLASKVPLLKRVF